VKAAQGDTLEYIWGGGPVRLIFDMIVDELMSSIPLLYQMGLMYVINPLKQVALILGNVSLSPIVRGQRANK
jgi:hypothetical protein